MKKEKFPRGLVQVYTGNGKGKTTAALGLAFRAAGHGFKVLIVQFMKGGIGYGELKSAKRLAPFLTIKSMGRKEFVSRKAPHDRDIELARKAWDLARRSVQSKEYQIVILDEINVAVDYGLVSLQELLTCVKEKPKDVELVLTGRSAKPAVLRCADLVTEMRGKKHYYQKGIGSRIGIEL
jgi:cob(I)alamin adenosyltransferase